MKTGVLFLASSVLLSIVILLALHLAPPSSWLWLTLIPSAGSDGLLWQVQTTFVSVGFAGLAIAAQLFADSPLAIGASRRTVLIFVRAGWFVGVSLAGNLVIALETIWLPSPLGVAFVLVVWALPSVAFLVHSTLKLVDLFGRPSLLDDLIRRALVEAISQRLSVLSRRNREMREQLRGLVVSADTPLLGPPRIAALRVPVADADRVVRAVRARHVRLALRALAPRPALLGPAMPGQSEEYEPAQIHVEVAPGERTRPGGSLFRVVTPVRLASEVESTVVRLLQESVELEPADSTSPYEDLESEIAALKDAVGTSLRSGAFATAERALRLLGDILHELWTSPITLEEGEHRGSSEPWRDLLHRTLGDVERDVQQSRRAADMFVSAAMTRALRASRSGVTGYVDDSLRSFVRLWRDVLELHSSEFRTLPSRVVVCVENLAHFASSTAHEASEYRARATWTFVELVKAAIDSSDASAARLAARELAKLFVYREVPHSRDVVRAGQLVLSGWVAYLAASGEPRAEAALAVAESVRPNGSRKELLVARDLVKRGGNPVSRWDWWEMDESGSGSGKVLTLDTYIDRSLLRELVTASGSLPAATLDLSFDYRRYLSMLEGLDGVPTDRAAELREKLLNALAAWDVHAAGRLAAEPLSESRIESLTEALRVTFAEGSRLAAVLGSSDSVPEEGVEERPILGMNLRVPRVFLVAEGFDQTIADPAHIGESIAQGFIDGEHARFLEVLRRIQPDAEVATALEIQDALIALGTEAEHYVLLTPYGGFLDWSVWYSDGLQSALARVNHIELSGLEGEVLLFDARKTLRVFYAPEEKIGLLPLKGSSIAVGVFEDVQEGDEPQVRVEAGERFIVWPGRAPVVQRFRESVGGETLEEADSI